LLIEYIIIELDHYVVDSIHYVMYIIPLIIELGPNVLDDLRHFTTINKWAMQLEKLDIYVFTFVIT
jgi:hypothetical protein